MRLCLILVKFLHLNLNPNLEDFLSEDEKELFTVADSKPGYSNLSKEEWKANGTLADDRTIVIKKGRQRVLCCCLGP